MALISNPVDFGVSVGLSLTDQVDALRLNACSKLEQNRRGQLGQYLTSAPVARLMSSLLDASTPTVSVLDAGAGIGALFAACVAELCHRKARPKEIKVVAYEIQPQFLDYLFKTVELCRSECERSGVAFSAEIKCQDFLEEISHFHQGDLFTPAGLPTFTVVIINPPYRKINSHSEARQFLRRIGIETTNLYTGFMASAIKLLASDGELVAITPRSFCNGTYFRNFRKDFLAEMGLSHIHLFNSRQEAFRDDAILQETMIIRAVKSLNKPQRVIVSSSVGAEDEFELSGELPYEDVVPPDDQERFIRIVPDGLNQEIVAKIACFQTPLNNLGLTVSTGRVVDFRAKEFLRGNPEENTVPLIYPINLESGTVVWPKHTKKSQALLVSPQTKSLLVPNGNYVLVRRFSAKEEKKRIVSAVFDSGQFCYNWIGFENHLNYYHQNGLGLDPAVAKGLSIFLNSTMVDGFFRLFSGHTQVNATDLRSLKYPTLEQLRRLGERRICLDFSQDKIDDLIEEEFFNMAESANSNPIAAKKRIDEALEILTALGFPRAQLNERSALTLLAILNLKSTDKWSAVASPLLGITPIMDFMEREYGKRYAPNTRETVRRQTMHQFLDAGLVVANPDQPNRPINSGKFAYQVEASALQLFRTYGTGAWEHNLSAYIASVETLKMRYAQEREMTRIPIEISSSLTITLSPGGQNILVEQVIKEFAPRFTPGGHLLYVGDTDDKFAYLDRLGLATLGIQLEMHGKMPDVIIHFAAKNWLVLVEAVTSHGPINPKRKTELQNIFHTSTAGLVLVTTFLSRKAMVQYLPEISWETEVWVAESPAHMIHFNGDRFLGPY